MNRFKPHLLWLFGLSMIWIGVQHFITPQIFMDIMPPYLPWHFELVLISGAFEIAGGLGLLIPRTRKAAAWGLIALFVCVFPANIHMAINDVPFMGEQVPDVLRWGRLPLQLVFIGWAYQYTRTKSPVTSS
jgi:uncharacterized membrane protein